MYLVFFSVLTRYASNEGVDAYLVNTDANPEIVEKYLVPIGDNTITITRSLVG